MAGLGKYLLFLFVVVILASSLLVIQPVKAQVENVATSCAIFVDNIVEGQPINVVVQIYPAPPSGEIFDNLFVWITSPMQGVWGNGGNGPWGKSHISTDTNGKATVNFDISTFSGYWNIGLYFEGQYFANNTIYYQPGDWQRGFTVLPAKTPTPSPTATPAPSPIPTSAPTPTLPNMGPTSPPTLISTDLTVTLALVAIAVVVISVISLLLFVRHLKRNIPKPDSSTI